MFFFLSAEFFLQNLTSRNTIIQDVKQLGSRIVRPALGPNCLRKSPQAGKILKYKFLFFGCCFFLPFMVILSALPSSDEFFQN